MKKPRPYQKEAIDFATDHNCLIGDSCGLGKSLEAIETIKRLRSNSGGVFNRPVLLLVRKTAGQQWEEMIREQDVKDPIYRLGTAGSGFPDELEEGSWVITHHESLDFIYETLMTINWSIVVADEVHRFKNRKIRRTHRLWTLRTVRKIGLSGTLMEKLPTDYWANLHWIEPNWFTSYWAFHDKFVETEINYMGYHKDIGLMPGMESEFRDTLSPYVIQRTKEEVLPDLPPKIEQRVEIEMNEKQLAAYRKIERADDILVELDPGNELMITNVLAWITRMLQVSTDPALLGLDIPSSKIEWLKDYMEDNANETIAIFTTFRDTAIKLAGIFDAALVVGRQASTVNDFLLGRKRAVVGTIAALGESLNLQRASTTVFVDQTWSSVLMTQAVDRVHRMDIKDAKNIIYLVSRGAIADDRVYQAFQGKWTQVHFINEVLHGGRLK